MLENNLFKFWCRVCLCKKRSNYSKKRNHKWCKYMEQEKWGTNNYLELGKDWWKDYILMEQKVIYGVCFCIVNITACNLGALLQLKKLNPHNVWKSSRSAYSMDERSNKFFCFTVVNSFPICAMLLQRSPWSLGFFPPLSLSRQDNVMQISNTMRT